MAVTTPTSFTDWGLGNALSFNGTNQSVNILLSPSLNVTKNITVTAWIYINSWKESDIVESGNNGYMLWTAPSKGNTIAWGKQNSGATQVYSNTTFNNRLNQWIFVAGIYDGTTLKIYINGALDNSKAASFSFVNTVVQIANGTDTYFNGLIDEVRIYNRPLSAAEILQLYNRNYSIAKDDTLVGLWHFDESIGATTASDSSNSNNNGFANNGTLKNSPAWTAMGLQWQTNYSWQAKANGPGGSTPSNTTAPAQTLLCAPTKPGLAITSFCNSGAVNTTLRWSYTTKTSQYQIYRNDVNIKPINSGDSEFGLRTWTDATGLVANTSYTYYINAINTAGTTPSDTISVTTPGCTLPSPPSNFTANFVCCDSSTGKTARTATVILIAKYN